MSATRLIHVDDGLPCISRARSGAGWRYHDAEGRIIRERQEIDRLNAIALPLLRARLEGDLNRRTLCSERTAAAVGSLPRPTRHVSRYERGFLTYLERAPAAAVLLQSA